MFQEVLGLKAKSLCVCLQGSQGSKPWDPYHAIAVFVLFSFFPNSEFVFDFNEGSSSFQEGPQKRPTRIPIGIRAEVIQGDPEIIQSNHWVESLSRIHESNQ